MPRPAKLVGPFGPRFRSYGPWRSLTPGASIAETRSRWAEQMTSRARSRSRSTSTGTCVVTAMTKAPSLNSSIAPSGEILPSGQASRQCPAARPGRPRCRSRRTRETPGPPRSSRSHAVPGRIAGSGTVRAWPAPAATPAAPGHCRQHPRGERRHRPPGHPRPVGATPRLPAEVTLPRGRGSVTWPARWPGRRW